MCIYRSHHKGNDGAARYMVKLPTSLPLTLYTLMFPTSQLYSRHLRAKKLRMWPVSLNRLTWRVSSCSASSQVPRSPRPASGLLYCTMDQYMETVIMVRVGGREICRVKCRPVVPCHKDRTTWQCVRRIVNQASVTCEG